MGNSAGQRSDRFHLLGLPQLLLEFSLLGDVPEIPYPAIILARPLPEMGEE